MFKDRSSSEFVLISAVFINVFFFVLRDWMKRLDIKSAYTHHHGGGGGGGGSVSSSSSRPASAASSVGDRWGGI